MDINDFFGDTELVFNTLGNPKTKEELLRALPFEFNGKNDFIDFYHAHNGVFFPEGAKVSSSKIYENRNQSFDELEVECFYDIDGRLEKMWAATKEMSPEANAYAETHVPIARDSAGNEFWIEISSGNIKYISWEYGLPDGEILVSPNFKKFCLGIQSFD